MGVYGDSISTAVPSVGDSETTASANVATLLEEFKTRLQNKITQGEIQLSAALDFSSQGADNLAYVELVTRGSAPTTRETLYTKNVAGVDELFYQDSAGQEVQVSSNGALRISATGAITGAGYGAGGVEVAWNAAGNAYQFKLGAGSDDYAAVVADTVQIRDGSNHKITLDSPSLAADYTLELPSGPPASGSQLLAMNSSGVVALTPTLPSAERYLTIDNTGALATTQNGLSYAEVRRHASLAAFSGSGWNYSVGDVRNSTTANSTVDLPLPVVSGERLQTLYYSVRTGLVGTISVTVYEANGAGSTVVASHTSPGVGNNTLSLGDTPVTDDRSYYVTFSVTSGSLGSAQIYALATGVNRAL